MLNFWMNAILWTLAIYGMIEIIKIIVFERLYSINKIEEGTNIIITVKNGEKYIEGFLRNLLFKIIYDEEEFVKEIFIVDLDSTDKTKEILQKISNDYEYIKIIDIKEYEEILGRINT